MNNKAIELIEEKIYNAKNYEDVNPWSNKTTKKDIKENEKRIKIYQYILDILEGDK